MNQNQITVGYDEFFLKPINERMEILQKLSPDNKAYLVKTQAERWLTVNCSKITSEKIALLEEIIQSISPEWYVIENRKKFLPEVEAMCKKLEENFSRQEAGEISTLQSKYIPIIEDKK